MSQQFPDPFSVAELTDPEIAKALHLLQREDVGLDSKEHFLTSLHRRGETAAELAGFARAILAECVPVNLVREESSPLLELCGTGGDRAGFINISTAAMFVAAGAGARVVKHGNRGVSSRCGSADVLEALGIALHLRPETVGVVLEKAGCVFLLASDFHPVLASLAALRKLLATRGQMTVFNLLGPLLNPALPETQLTGIFNPGLLEFYAEALGMLGRKKAWAVHGEGLHGVGGVDELSISGPSSVVEMKQGEGKEMLIRKFTLDPGGLGFPVLKSSESLLGGDATGNAGRIRAILSGCESGAACDMILLNAGAALHLAGIGSTLSESIALARESLDSRRALKSLEMLCYASVEGSV
jgi:anthranilate phosphoribosyltransferase